MPKIADVPTDPMPPERPISRQNATSKVTIARKRVAG